MFSVPPALYGKRAWSSRQVINKSQKSNDMEADVRLFYATVKSEKNSARLTRNLEAPFTCSIASLSSIHFRSIVNKVNAKEFTM